MHLFIYLEVIDSRVYWLWVCWCVCVYRLHSPVDGVSLCDDVCWCVCV